MPEEYKYDAFISYRHANRALARQLLRDLESAGYKVAIDERDFGRNLTFLEELERCIKESRFTLALLSPEYLDSGNCVEEAIICKVLDMGARKRRLVPLVLEKVERPVWLYDITGIDYTDTDPLVPHFEQLTGMLGNPG
jgi:hypothetical protein